MKLAALFFCTIITIVLGRSREPNDPFYCNRNDSLNVTIRTYQRPGIGCDSNSDCCNNCTTVCVNNHCRGLKLAAHCNSTLDCDVGLYCNKLSNTCVNTQLAGQFCNRTILCNSYLICVNHRCVEYGSIPTGSVMKREFSQGSFLQYACATGYATNSSNDFICTEGYTRINTIITCENGIRNCTYKADRKSVV